MRWSSLIRPEPFSMKLSTFVLLAFYAATYCQATGGRNERSSGRRRQERPQQQGYDGTGQELYAPPQQEGEEGAIPFGHDQTPLLDRYGSVYTPSHQRPSYALPPNVFLPVDFPADDAAGMQQKQPSPRQQRQSRSAGRVQHFASLGSSHSEYRGQYENPPPAFDPHSSGAFDTLTQQTAAMQLGGIASIHTRGGYGEEAQSGSMTSRARRNNRGKDVRLPDEPQTARFGRSSQGQEDEDEGTGGGNEGLGFPPQTDDFARALVLHEWQMRGLNCEQYSPEDLARQAAEIKINNPGYEMEINRAIRRMVKASISDEILLGGYLKSLTKATNACTKSVSYFKGHFVNMHPGQGEIPIPLLLQQFREAKHRERRRKEAQFLLEHGDQSEYQQGEPAIVTAEHVYDDFTIRMINPAARAGYPYNMALVGHLLANYVHDFHAPEQTRDYIVMYLREVQHASDSDIDEMLQAMARAANQQQGAGQHDTSTSQSRPGREGSRGRRG